MNSKKILFIVPYPIGKAPSQRFRFEQYFYELSKAGHKYDVEPFLDDKTWDILYQPGLVVPKALGILGGFLRRSFLLFQLSSYHFLFIHREATPIGPPWFEWIAAKLLKKKIIYDFDDAIWIPNTSDNNKMVAGLKWHHKVDSICKWAYKVSCGNAYLQSYALKFNPNAFVIPTTIDTVNHHNQIKNQQTEKFIIGWTGTHSTMKYLDAIVPVLQKLEQKYDFEFRVISNQAPDFSLKSLVFVPWRKETEIQDLLTFNVGLMPLEDDLWAKGKCAFKALQYMALGIPAIVSPVGMNTEVVNDGINGFICNTPEEWYAALEKILQSPELRFSLGKAAREKIEQNYAVISVRERFVQLFS